MRRFLHSLSIALFSLTLLFCAAPTSALAQEAASEEKSSEDADKKAEASKKEIDRLLNRYHGARRYSALLRGEGYEPQSMDGKSPLVLDTIEYGHLYDGSPDGTRYFVARLHLINLTDGPLTFRKDDIVLHIEDQKLKQSDVPAKIENQSFPIGQDQSRQFKEIQRPDEVVVPPGEAKWQWIFFHQLEHPANLPDVELHLTVSGQKRKMDLKQEIAGQLGVTLRRIGPAGALALFEIRGRLNNATLSLLGEQFEKLVKQNITRVVIHWSKSSQKVDSSISHFLYQYAVESGRESTNRNRDERFPLLSQELREVHLSDMKGTKYSSSNARKVMHDDLDSAVAAALWSAMEVLPTQTILEQIEQGDLLVRPVALSAGAPRLAPDHLDLVLSLLRTADPKSTTAKAAVYALRHFGQPEATAALIELVKTSGSPLASAAVDSLTHSRYRTSRRSLRTLIDELEGESRNHVLKLMAASPSPSWSDLFYEAARNPESGIRNEALQALNLIGHADLNQLLKESLHDKDEKMREAAFQIILNRGEPELESELEEVVLNRLKDSLPDNNLRNYLERTKNARAIPLLIAHLKAVKEDRSKRQSLIQLLGSIGDNRVASLFIELYPELTESEQSNVLNALGQMQVPEFLTLAADALKSKHSSLVYAAIQNLSTTDSREAEKILIEGFATIEHKSYYDNLANAISQIGSSEAEQVLRDGRKSESPEKRKAAIKAYRYYLQRKPSYQYIYQATYQMRTKNWEEALKLVKLSIEMDEQFAPAHATKGTVLLRLNQTEAAKEAFERAIELDPETPDAIAGMARVLLRNHNIKDALNMIQKGTNIFRDDSVFQFHVALFYGEAVALAKKPAFQKNVEGKDIDWKSRIDEWQYQSLKYLSDAYKNGQRDKQLIENAPEFEQFEKLPEFQLAMKGQLPERKEPKPIEDDPKSTRLTPKRDSNIIQTGGVVELLPAPPAR